jgi:uncharacterized oligopeptide transporter (OPT) family protein
LNAFFFWLEATALSTWVRESTSVFAFPTILSVHAIGMGLAVGVNVAIALRLLGFAPGVPPRELHRFAPVMWIGVWLNAASGLLLLVGYPTKAFTNPVFYMKISLIAAGMWLYVAMTRQILAAGSPGSSGPAVPSGRFLALASLACWAGAVTTGRLLAYTAHRILATW